VNGKTLTQEELARRASRPRPDPKTQPAEYLQWWRARYAMGMDTRPLRGGLSQNRRIENRRKQRKRRAK
jgi:hypothetical protein